MTERNILYYNVQRFPKFIQQHYPESFHRDFWRLRTIWTMAIMDRTETIETGFKYQILQPIPTIDGRLKPNLSELIDLRAREMMHMAAEQSKHILVYWSGGIDSTTMLVAFIKNKIPDVKIYVAMTDKSIEEHPTFYQNHVLGKLPIVDAANVTDELLANTLVTNGEYADHMWGTVITNDLPLNDLYSPNYEGPIHKLYTERLRVSPMQSVRDMEKTEKDAEKVMEYIAPQVAKCPVPIDNAFDYLWWLNYSLRWQCMDYMFLMKINFNTPPNTVYFFNTKDFEIWSMLSLKDRYYSTWTEYKLEFKQYIYEYDHDMNYFINKTKVRSMMHMNTFDDRYVAIMDSNEHIRFGQHAANPKLYRVKYGNTLDSMFLPAPVDPLDDFIV